MLNFQLISSKSAKGKRQCYGGGGLEKQEEKVRSEEKERMEVKKYKLIELVWQYLVLYDLVHLITLIQLHRSFGNKMQRFWNNLIY